MRRQSSPSAPAASARPEAAGVCGEEATHICAVYLLGASAAIDRLFDYLIPEAMTVGVSRGTLLTVPFGRGNRPETAVCDSIRTVAPGESPDACAEKTELQTGTRALKTVLRVLPPAYALTDEQYALCAFLCRYTLCSMGEAVYTVVPTAMRQGRENRHTVRTVRLLLPPNDAVALAHAGGRVSAAMEKALAGLADGLPHPLAAAADAAGVSTGVYETLAARGTVEITDVAAVRDPYAALRSVPGTTTSPIVLTTAQGRAYDALLSLYTAGRAAAALLFGVTGSGKTKVILKLIDRVLADGKSAIMMVPEIALTPQTVRIFYERYGAVAAVVHSSLSEGERMDAHRRIAAGEARIVIGTRSAVFAPVQDLGLIVIDEEHEHTYKSDRNPKYHARDVAAFRCGRHNAPLVLASATPSFESYEKATRGVYTLVPLRERFGGIPLPETEVVDMRAELVAGNKSPVSRRLQEALTEVLARGEQAILFLNRRGYSTAVQCRRCGAALTCPHCSVSMTYHTQGGGYLLCHQCGYRIRPPRTCPACGAEPLSYAGFGTEKVEDDLRTFLPEARILRMDADTTTTKGAFDGILTTFREGGADILLGTQMVTKGHDFPRVSLVGVILADTSMYAADFRAGERAFSLLTQVIGRAGRAVAGGRAVIQSYTPASALLALACRQDYEAFYRQESALRRATVFPPFCDLVQITVTGTREDVLTEKTKELFDKMTAMASGAYADLPMTFYGPFEAQVYRECDRFRLRIAVKCRLNNRVRGFFTEAIAMFASDKHITVSADLSPQTV